MLSKPRDLLVVRSIGAAYASDGTLARDTLRTVGERAYCPDVAPQILADQEVVRVHDEEVVWGGWIAPHFGHFLTESVARLWPLLPGGELAGLPVVFAKPKRLPFVVDWLEAFGARVIDLPERGAVRFKRMFVPEPAWRLNAWVAPEIRDIHLHARRGLDVPAVPPRDVLWLSRSRLKRDRVAYDECLLEWLLREHVTAIHPEALPLAEQIAELEASRAVAGIVGSAFHTLLMTDDPPDCLYLYPSWDKSQYAAQHRFLDANVSFAKALAVAAREHRMREVINFPGGYRMLIPETLQALNATLLPTLLEDPVLATMADPEGFRLNGGGSSVIGELEVVVARVLREPLDVEGRMELGAIFEERGMGRCAIEQFSFAADLADDRADAPLHAARLLALDGQHNEAFAMAKRALSIDPDSQEAVQYVIA